MYKIETTTDCLVASQDLLKKAFEVKDREQHATWWDNKVDVLRCIINALETGYFTGIARDELKEAQYTISRAEKIAGKWFTE
jgi:hypothetical protein